MKHIIIGILLIISSALYSQGMKIDLYLPKYDKKDYYKKGVEAGCNFLAGVAYGYNQLSRHNFKRLQAVHPWIDEQFWGPTQWLNKYKNRDPEQGPAFWGSTKAFVIFTDAHHSTMFIDQILTMTGVTIGQIGVKKQKWWIYALEVGAMFVIRSAGFTLIYDVIY